MAKIELCITLPVSLQEEFVGVVRRVEALREMMLNHLTYNINHQKKEDAMFNHVSLFRAIQREEA